MSLVRVVILTKSSKFGGYCVAGIDIDTGQWIRFCKDGNKELHLYDIRYRNGSYMEILDVVEKEVKQTPSNIQPENVSINTSTTFRKLGTCTMDDVLRIHPCEVQEKLLGNYSYNLQPDEIIEGKSLILIKAENLELYKVDSFGREKTKIDFKYNHRRYTNIAVTDQNYFNITGKKIREAILVISLPDDEWSKNNSYFKFVAKIFEI